MLQVPTLDSVPLSTNKVTAIIRIGFGHRYKFQVFCEFVALDLLIPYLSLRSEATAE